MAGSWEFWLTDDVGARIRLLSGVTGCTMLRVASGIGQITIRVDTTFDTKILVPNNRDFMIQAWRAPEGGRLALWRAFFLRRWTLSRDQNSSLQIELGGPDVNDLVRRRMVVNYAGTAESIKSGAADDTMKEFVDEQAVNDASDPSATYGDRAFPDFSVEGDVSLGNTFETEGSWMRLVDLLGAISDGSRADGAEIFWDVVVVNVGPPITLKFVTRLDQPGRDRSDSAVFSDTIGNLTNPVYHYDASDEVNYVYVSGEGTAELMETAQAYDSVRVDTSRYNRCESPGYAAYSGDGTIISDAGASELRAGEPLETFTADLIDAGGMKYGRDWNFGDRVTARFAGREYQTVVRKVMISLDNKGRETIQARLEYLGVGS